MSPGRPVVLLVEDDEPLRQLYRLALELRGFDVEVAGDGIAALHLIEEAPPQIIVLDLQLPCLDGLAVAAELAAHTETRKVPVVIETGSSERFDERPFAAVLRKPVAADDLARIVEECLGASGFIRTRT